MQSQIIPADSPASDFIAQLAASQNMDQISNHPGAVRHHIFSHSQRDKATGKLTRDMLFAVYDSSRHGPETGYRMCLVHADYHIASRTKEEGAPEDEIDYIEREIPLGHKEYVILGKLYEPPAQGEDDKA